MNTKKFSIYLVLLAIILAFSACQPEEYSMGTILSKEDLNFSITQNPDDPNMIILESLTPGVTPLWQTPMGRSTKLTDTVKIPFMGDYKFVYGIESPGGYVQADTFRLSLTTNNLSYVDDPLWTNLTGGVGHKKTWRFDYGNYGLNAGPLTYCEPQTTWDEWQNGTAAIGWAPSWQDNTWIIEEADTASRMTFALTEGAIMTTHKVTEGVDETGTFFLDADNHTLSTTDATILRSNSFIANATNWNNNLVILELTENQLMVGVRRTNEEGDYLYVWNFVSEEYAASYVPEDLPDPEPTLPDGWQDDISQVVSTTIAWKLSDQTPFEWANLDGSLMNGWQSPGDYPDWLGGILDPSAYANFSMTMNSADQSVVFVTPDGTETTGTYTLDEKGIYSFDMPVPSFTLVGWASFSADANNQLRITKIEKDAGGNVTGMWLGKKDPEKPEYMVYHLVPQMGGGEVEPLAAWKNALKGKTLVPDVNYFADWYGIDWSGGWSAGTYPDDFTSQSWFWTQEVHDACLASSISFYVDGDVLKADAVDNGTAKSNITVDIDPDNETLTFSEAPFTFSWIFTNNGEGMGPWLFGSHDGASLANIADKGIYLGFYSKFDETDPEIPVEITAFHMVLDN
ncbi:MAG: hypothetical protein ACK5HT_08745 [Draconibacterium sp.]